MDVLSKLTGHHVVRTMFSCPVNINILCQSKLTMLANRYLQVFRYDNLKKQIFSHFSQRPVIDRGKVHTGRVKYTVLVNILWAAPPIVLLKFDSIDNYWQKWGLNPGPPCLFPSLLPLTSQNNLWFRIIVHIKTFNSVVCTNNFAFSSGWLIGHSNFRLAK